MLNEVVLMGRMTKDADLRSTQSGKSVASFTIAVDSGYGENKKADFINCVAWGKTAEFVSNWFKKGEMIALTGRISTRTFDGSDGRKNYVTEVIAREVEFCGGKKDNSPAEDVPEEYTAPMGTDEDLPF